MTASARPAMVGIKYVSMEGGYGVAAERTVAALGATGVPLTWAPMQHGRAWGSGWEPSRRRDLGPPQLRPWCNRPMAADTVIVHTVPDHFANWARQEAGKRLFGYVAWETTQLPASWPDWLAAMDAVVVPSTWNVSVLARALAGPVHVVPHPCDPTPLPEVARAADEFCFYSIGVWSTRKNLAELVIAFCRAFTARDRVRLILKTTPGDLTRRRRPWSLPGRPGRVFRRFFGAGHVPVRATVAAIRREFADPPPVELVTRPLSEDGMRALHARGDAFVSLARGEGWGLGAFDAATHGRPVVMTGFGGPLDYLDPARSWLVDCDLESCAVPERELWTGYTAEQQWARPRLAHAVAQLRAVRHDPAAREKAHSLAADIRERFAPARVAGLWLDLLAPRADAASSLLKR